MVRSGLLLFVTFLLFLAAPALLAEDQDIIILKEGGMYKGEIIYQSRSTVKIKVEGKTLTLKMKDIRKIIARYKPEDEYKNKVKELDARDAEAQYKLALWCLENSMEKEADKHFKLAIRHAPDHEGARTALGYGFYNGEWLTAAQLDELGLVRFEKDWIPKADLEGAIRKRREKRFEEWEAILTQGDEEAGALMKELDHSYKSIRLQGQNVYGKYQRDRKRL